MVRGGAAEQVNKPLCRLSCQRWPSPDGLYPRQGLLTISCIGYMEWEGKTVIETHIEEA
jgi:hypothetical protein